MKKQKHSKPQAVEAPVEPKPAEIVTVEPLEGSGDSVIELPEPTAEQLTVVDKETEEARVNIQRVIAEMKLEDVGTETTPVVPATAEKLVFCDPPGEWRKL